MNATFKKAQKGKGKTNWLSETFKVWESRIEGYSVILDSCIQLFRIPGFLILVLRGRGKVPQMDQSFGVIKILIKFIIFCRFNFCFIFNFATRVGDTFSSLVQVT